MYKPIIILSPATMSDAPTFPTATVKLNACPFVKVAPVPAVTKFKLKSWANERELVKILMQIVISSSIFILKRTLLLLQL